MASIFCNGVRFDAIRAVIFDKDGTLADSRQYLWHLGEKRADAIVQALKTASFGKFWLRPGRNVPPKSPKMGDLGGDPTSQTQQINSIDLALKTAILETFGCNQPSIDPAGRLAVGTREENEIAIASLIAETGYNLNQARSLVHAAFLAADQQLPRKAPLTPLFVGVIELVKSLSPLKLGILSSDTEANIQDFVETYQLSPYFSAIVGAQTGISKPNPKLLALACEALNIEPETALVIGDTSADTKLTPRSIGVTWGGSTIAQLDNVAAIADQPADIQLCRI
ncbi:HAD family hydrolase [Leptolyngbya sp. FACHB-17]|uniref:HAD family hydrolase n=1 Tax=unclassified Leptolyngbya TaxID=2650499 RepID=UPI001681AFE4|nr:HAD family hydrolase [Leptolyngbya sp. FACHB-17]MBD2080851.1 HAD family hydrolase [Leptolyngbya sp. FACHB-17]